MWHIQAPISTSIYTYMNEIIFFSQNVSSEIPRNDRTIDDDDGTHFDVKQRKETKKNTIDYIKIHAFWRKNTKEIKLKRYKTDKNTAHFDNSSSNPSAA